MQAAENLKDEDMLKLSLQTVGASVGVIVDDKPNLEEWFIDRNFLARTLRCQMKAKHLYMI